MTRRRMWVEFVVGSLLALRSFLVGAPVSPSPQKPTFLNSEGHIFLTCKTVKCHPH